jgi:hypothetical protein
MAEPPRRTVSTSQATTRASPSASVGGSSHPSTIRQHEPQRRSRSDPSTLRSTSIPMESASRPHNVATGAPRSSVPGASRPRCTVPPSSRPVWPAGISRAGPTTSDHHPTFIDGHRRPPRTSSLNWHSQLDEVTGLSSLDRPRSVASASTWARSNPRDRSRERAERRAEWPRSRIANDRTHSTRPGRS